MQKAGSNPDRHPRVVRTTRLPNRHRHFRGPSPTDAALERRLMAEFWRYSLDVPRDAFPSFLESLHYDTLN